MISIHEQIVELKKWFLPRYASHKGGLRSFLLSSHFVDTPALDKEIEEMNIDCGMVEFWRYSSSADLFKDIKYGQWGLHIMSPSEAKFETEKQILKRGKDFFYTDFIIGSFFGDSDLLFLDTSSFKNGENRVIVAAPLDKREDWPVVGNSFSEFLYKYLKSEGDKYWC